MLDTKNKKFNFYLKLLIELSKYKPFESIETVDEPSSKMLETVDELSSEI